MSSFPILDLVIGIIFIYFLLSIICSSAVELWFSILKTRARLMEDWLKQIFNLPALDSNGQPLNVSIGQSIMDHCMVTALSKTGKSTSYIDAENFVSALLDKITITPAATDNSNVQLPPPNLAGYITLIQNSTLISGELKRTILLFANEASQAATALSTIPVAANITANITTAVKSELELFRDRLEKWYDTNADRLTGTFKRRKALPATIIMAIIITVSLNADSVEISRYLYSNKEASKQLATTAINTYQNYNKSTDTLYKTISIGKPEYKSTIQDLDTNTIHLKKDFDSLKSLDLPIGWKATNVTDGKSFLDYSRQPAHIAGWLATILAIMMGAPFWFDILNKIANLRGAGPKPSSGSNADVKNS